MSTLLPHHPAPARPALTRRRLCLRFLYFAAAVYFGVFIALATMQRTFMYHPTRGPESEFLALAKSRNVTPWRDAKGVLLGWKRIAKTSAKASSKAFAQNRMLILHGNGGHALTLTYLMDGFSSSNWDFYALEYPGYGWRGGEITQSEIIGASNEALEELLKADARPLYITGESLGTGVASALAAAHPKEVRGLFLVTPYTSTLDVAIGRFPMYPVRLVMQDNYDSAAALQEYSGPVAILLAGNDYIVPTRFGQALFDGYNGPKKLWVQPNAGHNTLDFNPRQSWWKQVENFLMHSSREKLVKQKAS